jgi:hypothetical protein
MYSPRWPLETDLRSLGVDLRTDMTWHENHFVEVDKFTRWKRTPIYARSSLLVALPPRAYCGGVDPTPITVY